MINLGRCHPLLLLMSTIDILRRLYAVQDPHPAPMPASLLSRSDKYFRVVFAIVCHHWSCLHLLCNARTFSQVVPLCVAISSISFAAVTGLKASKSLKWQKLSPVSGASWLLLLVGQMEIM